MISEVVLNELKARFFHESYDLPADCAEQRLQRMAKVQDLYYYYVDFLCSRNKCDSLDSILHQLCPVLGWSIPAADVAWVEFEDHRAKATRCGGILFNETNDAVLLVQGCQSRTRNGRNWFFPAGKQELGESEHESAIREVAEEVGYTAAHDKTALEWVSDRSKKHYFLVFRSVPTAFRFRPKLRHEIGAVRWVPLTRLAHTLPSYCTGLAARVVALADAPSQRTRNTRQGNWRAQDSRMDSNDSERSDPPNPAGNASVVSG